MDPTQFIDELQKQQSFFEDCIINLIPLEEVGISSNGYMHSLEHPCVPTSELTQTRKAHPMLRGMFLVCQNCLMHHQEVGWAMSAVETLNTLTGRLIDTAPHHDSDVYVKQVVHVLAYTFFPRTISYLPPSEVLRSVDAYTEALRNLCISAIQDSTERVITPPSLERIVAVHMTNVIASANDSLPSTKAILRILAENSVYHAGPWIVAKVSNESRIYVEWSLDSKWVANCSSVPTKEQLREAAVYVVDGMTAEEACSVAAAI